MVEGQEESKMRCGLLRVLAVCLMVVGDGEVGNDIVNASDEDDYAAD